MAHQPTILIVEDDDYWQNNVISIVKQAFAPIEPIVDLVISKEEAIKHLETKRYHITVIDSHIFENSKKANSDLQYGLDILQYIKSEKLAFDDKSQLTFKYNIYISGVATHQNFNQAAVRLGARPISKDPRADFNKKDTFEESLEYEMRQIIKNDLKINFDLYDTLRASDKYEIQKAVQNIAPKDNTTFQFDVEEQIYDILGKLIQKPGPDEPNIRHTSVRTLNPGLSGSAIIRIQTFRGNGTSNTPYAVKITRRDKAFTEASRYQKHITDLANILDSPILRMEDVKYTYELGGIQYNFGAEGDGNELRELETMYIQVESMLIDSNTSTNEIEKQANKLLTCIHQLFSVCSTWYTHNIRDARLLQLEYYKALEVIRFPKGLSTNKIDEELLPYQSKIPEKLISRAIDAIPQIIEDASAHKLAQNVTLEITALDQNVELDVINPFWWLEKYGHKLNITSRYSKTHGDLNARNIMVLQNMSKAYLIDFYRAGESHFLRDFVLLEIDIKFRLMVGTSENLRLKVEEFTLFEEALSNHFTNIDEAQYNISSLPIHAQLAFNIIKGIREFVINNYMIKTNYRKEYLIALLMMTLNILRMKRLDTFPVYVKQLAFISAFRICEELTSLMGLARNSEIVTKEPIILSSNTEDKARRENLANKMNAGQLVLLIGSGHIDNVPSLKTFAMQNSQAENEDADAVITRLANIDETQLKSLLIDYFADKPIPAIYDAISRLPISEIYSFNVHNFLTSSFSERGKIVKEIIKPSALGHLGSNEFDIKLYKFYGSLSQQLNLDEGARPLIHKAEREVNIERVNDLLQLLKNRINEGGLLLAIGPTPQEARKINHFCYSQSNSINRFMIAFNQFSKDDKPWLEERNARFLGDSPKSIIEYLVQQQQ